MIVVGAGPNGLTAAALLAGHGLRPLVLERREVVGGAAVTEEFHPGFRASTVAHTAGPYRPGVLRELGIHALEQEEPEPRLLALFRDAALPLFGDPRRAAAEIGRFSPADAARYPDFHATLGRISGLLARILEMTPPDLDRPGPRDLWSLLRAGLAFRRLGRADAQRLLRWGPMAVADFAHEWFETDVLRAVVAARGILGMGAGPWSAGTTANLLLQAAAGGGNGAGSTVLVRGGLGALTRALAGATERRGGTIRTGAAVARFHTRDGRVGGVVLASGEEVEARAVVSSLDPRRTFLDMLDPALLDPDDLRRIRGYRIAGTAAKVNLALGGLPSFRALRGTDGATALRGRIHVGPDVDSLERAFDDAKYGRLSARPYLDVTIPSLSDPSLCPPGAHVLSAYVQYAPYRLAAGDWRGHREQVGDRVVDLLEEHAPGLRSLVVGRQVLTPADLEEIYGLTGGHPFHGEHSLDQLFVARPLLGWGRYRAPLPGLYLCGASTHPGGGVTGGPGANAAREVLKDLRRRSEGRPLSR